MQYMDIFSYLNGGSALVYFAACLLCGLQLCFDIFSQRRHANTMLSKIVGSSLLIMSCSAVCYILSDLLTGQPVLYRIGTSLDIFVFIGYATSGYVLYTNNEPSRGKLIALASPFVLLAILNLCVPSWYNQLFFLGAAIMFVYFICFGVSLLRRERLLGDLFKVIQNFFYHTHTSLTRLNNIP